MIISKITYHDLEGRGLHDKQVNKGLFQGKLVMEKQVLLVKIKDI